jgi:hypothetical protein
MEPAGQYREVVCGVRRPARCLGRGVLTLARHSHLPVRYMDAAGFTLLPGPNLAVPTTPANRGVAWAQV